jgi:hypothetical protein
MRTRSIFAAVGVAVAIALTGCGADSTPATVQTPVVTTEAPQPLTSMPLVDQRYVMVIRGASTTIIGTDAQILQVGLDECSQLNSQGVAAVVKLNQDAQADNGTISRDDSQLLLQQAVGILCPEFIGPLAEFTATN